MHEVSEAFKLASHSATQRHKIELYLTNPLVASAPTVKLTDDHIEAGTLEVVNQCSDSKDLAPGAVYIGQMSVTIASMTPYISPFTRGQWVGGIARLVFKILIDEAGDTWESIPVGQYEIASAIHTDRGVKIVAYDFMSRLDKPIDTEVVYGIPWQVITAICHACGIEFAQSPFDIQYFPNANEILGLYPDSGISTYREMLSAIVQTLGAFATVGRDGKLYVKRFGETPTDTINTDQRYTGAKFSDYTTKYTHLTDGTNEDGLTYEWGDYSGATVSLGGNPFLMYGEEDDRNRQHIAILNEIKRWKYIPFTATTLCGVEYDLGDVIRFEGGLAGGVCDGIINKFVWKYKKGYTMNGYGTNPNLSKVSRTSKATKSAQSQAKAALLRFFRYSNLGEISWTAEGMEHVEDEKTVGFIDFVSTGETIAEFWAQFQLRSTTWFGEINDAIIITRAYMDDELVAEVKELLEYPRTPRTQTPFYETILGTETVESNSHRLKFTIQILNCWERQVYEDFIIDVGGVRATLKGQGLKEEREWDGQLKFEEDVRKIGVGLEVSSISDSGAGLEIVPLIALTFSDAIEPATVGIEASTEYTEAFYYSKEQNADVVVCGDGMVAADNRLI